MHIEIDRGSACDVDTVIHTDVGIRVGIDVDSCTDPDADIDTDIYLDGIDANDGERIYLATMQKQM